VTLPVTSAQTLLPPNTTWLQRVLAAAGQGRVGAIPVPIDTIKRPDVTPQAFEPWLAWELSTDLWLDTWSQEQIRWALAHSLEQHRRKGTLGLIGEYVSMIGGEVREAIRPPAKPFMEHRLTADERAKFLARFPQLRVYPFVDRVQLPWLCYMGEPAAHNGRFLNHSFPTNEDAGGRWTRTSFLFEPRTGVETQLTFRTLVKEPFHETERVFDEAILPPRPGSKYFLNQPPRAHVYLGRLDPVEARVLRIPRDAPFAIVQSKANYTTVPTGLELIDVYPEHAYIEHQAPAGAFFPGRGRCLAGAYVTTSIAWRYVYERWYLHDPTRVPDTRKRSQHLGHMRLGISPFTSEVKVAIWGTINSRHVNRFVWGHLRPSRVSSDSIARACAAVSRAMSARDQVLINTNVLRTVQVGDAVMCDGSIAVGDLIEG
jgi:phage tail P2-like protein